MLELIFVKISLMTVFCNILLLISFIPVDILQLYFFLEMHKELNYPDDYLNLSFANLDLCNEPFYHVLPP